MIAAKHLSGAAHAGLHFIKNQKNILARTNLTHGREVIVGRNNHAAFALNWLENDRSRFLIDGGFQGRGIPIRNESHIKQRQKWSPKQIAPRNRERAKCFPMKRIDRGNEFRFSSVETGKLKRTLDGLGAG